MSHYCIIREYTVLALFGVIMNNRLSYILPLLFLIIFVCIVVNAEFARPRILVMMSYSSQNPWEQQIRDGITHEFQQQGKNYNIKYFYLGRLINTSPRMLANQVNDANHFIQSFKPSIMIIADDEAAEYIGKQYVDDPKMNLVFCGINADPARYGFVPGKNVTGIIENLHFDSMKTALQTIFPHYKSVIHLADASNNSNYIDPQFSHYQWAPLHLVENVSSNSYSDWKNAIAKANKNHDILLFTHFDTIHDDKGQLMSPHEVIKQTLKLAHVPMIGFFDYFVKRDKGPMALSTSGLEQGSVAAKLTMTIIQKNIKAGDLPFESSQMVLFSENKKAMALNMPNVKTPILYRSLYNLSEYVK